ncbi:MAG: phage minor capsid protein [Victivallaceae bacterium]
MNLIRAFLNSHANKGYKELSAKEKDMYAIYLASRGHIEDRIKEYVLQKRSSFTGPRLVMLMEELQDMFGNFEEEYRKTTKYAITYVAQSFYHSALVDLTENPNEVVGKLNKNTLDLMLEDNYTHVAGATKQMSKAAISNLRRISAQVMREASMTGETQIAVSKRLFYQNGGEKFIFAAKDGKKWNPDAYFEMLSRTMLHNNAREAYLQGCSDEKSDIVAISVSGNPCPACARWETRLLSISGTGKYPSLESARSSGLFHPNCTHRIIAVDPVIAEDDFDNKGRPKTGLNSKGKEQKDDKEAWREYRKKGALKSPKTQKIEKQKPKGWKSDNLQYPDNLDDLEKTIVKGKNEHVAVFDSETGRKIWVDEGTESEITGIPAMRVRNNIVTHI